MSYVVPNGQVRILTGVPIEDNFEHSLYFANATSQYNYFNARVKGSGYSFSDMSHIRVTTPGRKIKVEINVNNLLDCNYMMIQNNNTGKWFYCFIDRIEYVNENVSEISYTVDPIQTWMFDYSTNGELNNYCFVERQHGETDVAGDNLVNEPVNTGDYVIQKTIKYPDYTDWYMIVATTVNWGEGILPDIPLGVTRPQFIGGTLDTINFFAYPVDKVGDHNITAAEALNVVREVNKLLTNIDIFNSTSKVLNMFMIPQYFLYDNNADLMPGIRIFTPSSAAQTQDYGTYTSKGSMGDRTSSIRSAFCGSFQANCSPGYDDYNVRNKKLLTYPYCYMEGKNTQGDTIEYKYELFKSGSLYDRHFNLYSILSTNPQIICLPNGYGLSGNASTQQGILNYDKGLVLKDVPKCAFAINDFVAKLVQQTISMGITAAGYAVGGAIGGAIAGSAGAEPVMSDDAYVGLSDKAAIRAQARDEYRAEMQAYRAEEAERSKTIQNARKLGGAVAAIGLNAMKGGSAVNFGSGSASLLTGSFGFMFSEKRIKKEYAQIIDEFFDMYGYAQNRVMKPNIHARTKWTYIKTTNCSIVGSIPNDDAKLINNIFDNGITFWVNGSEVGNYGLANLNVPL